MEVVRHYDELGYLELAGQSVGSEHINKKFGFAGRLKKTSSEARLRAGKERPNASDDVLLVRFS
jgi:hypothetical protein